MITDRALDLQASALLLTVVEQQGGDLRAAFTVLCARVSIADLDGETFEHALARAIGALFRRPSVSGLTACEPSHLQTL